MVWASKLDALPTENHPAADWDLNSTIHKDYLYSILTS